MNLAARKQTEVAWLITILIGVTCMIWAALHKGPWIDEAWSSFVARHDLPLSETYRQRWAPDLHPPLFFFLSWLAEPLTGDGIVAKRLLNLIPLALASGAIAHFVARAPSGWALVAAGLAATSTVMLDTFADHRMYFTFLAAMLVCCFGLATIERDEVPTDRRTTVVMGASIVLGLNLQYVCALFFDAFLAVFIIRHWFGGNRPSAIRIAVPAAIGSALIFFTGVLQWPAAHQSAQNFWAHTDFRSALSFIAAAAVFCLAPYVAAFLAVALHPREAQAWRNRFATTAIAGIVAALAVALALNAVRPFIVRHYFFFMGPPLIVVIACLVAPIVNRSRAWTYVIIANALLLCVALAYQRAHQPQAAELAEFAASQVRGCPSAQVVTAGHWQVSSKSIRPFSVEPGATDWLYKLLASPRHFAPVPARRWRPGDQCPTIVWVENADVIPQPAEVASALGLSMPPAQIRAAATHRGSAGFAILYPATR